MWHCLLVSLFRSKICRLLKSDASVRGAEMAETHRRSERQYLHQEQVWQARLEAAVTRAREEAEARVAQQCRAEVEEYEARLGVCTQRIRQLEEEFFVKNQMRKTSDDLYVCGLESQKQMLEAAVAKLQDQVAELRAKNSQGERELRQSMEERECLAADLSKTRSDCEQRQKNLEQSRSSLQQTVVDVENQRRLIRHLESRNRSLSQSVEEMRESSQCGGRHHGEVYPDETSATVATVVAPVAQRSPPEHSVMVSPRTENATIMTASLNPVSTLDATVLPSRGSSRANTKENFAQELLQSIDGINKKKSYEFHTHRGETFSSPPRHNRHHHHRSFSSSPSCVDILSGGTELTDVCLLLPCAERGALA